MRRASRVSMEAEPRKTKPCEKRGCQELMADLNCLLEISPRCKKDGMTSRWHHISCAEHYCNECFDWLYRSHNAGHSLYTEWSAKWQVDANTLPNVKFYVTDEFLPYWVQCTQEGCSKWRRLPFGVELCRVDQNSIRCIDCSKPEEKCVGIVSNPYWITTLGHTPLLRYTLLTPLVKEYFPEGVGVSPSTLRYIYLKMEENQKRHGQDILTSALKSSNETGTVAQGNTAEKSSVSSPHISTTADVSSKNNRTSDVRMQVECAGETPVFATPLQLSWVQKVAIGQESDLHQFVQMLNQSLSSVATGQEIENTLVLINSLQRHLASIRERTLALHKQVRVHGITDVSPVVQSSIANKLIEMSQMLLGMVNSLSNPLTPRLRILEQLQKSLLLNAHLKGLLACTQAHSVPNSTAPRLNIAPHSGACTTHSFDHNSKISVKILDTNNCTTQPSLHHPDHHLPVHPRPLNCTQQAVQLEPSVNLASLPSLVGLPPSHTSCAGRLGENTGPKLGGKLLCEPPPKKMKLSFIPSFNFSHLQQQSARYDWSIDQHTGPPTTPLCSTAVARGYVTTSQPMSVPAYVPTPTGPVIRPPGSEPPAITGSVPMATRPLTTTRVSLPTAVTGFVPIATDRVTTATSLCKPPNYYGMSMTHPSPSPSPSVTAVSMHLDHNAVSSPHQLPLHPAPTTSTVQIRPVQPCTSGGNSTTIPPPLLPDKVSGEGGQQGVCVRKPKQLPVEVSFLSEDPYIPSAVSQVGILHDPFNPFNRPIEGERARAFTPDVMNEEEISAFPEYSKSPVVEVYLMLRNLVLSLWHRNCKTYLSVETCFKCLYTRGLVRIWCKGALYRVVHFLTRKGYINSGHLLDAVIPFPIAGCTKRGSVIVIGAGPSGVAAARHLSNFGYKVTVLEGRGQAGGRCKDDSTLGATLSMGAMIITGIDNNPITTLCHQLEHPLHLIVEDKCDLISENGSKPNVAVDKKVDGHFNGALDELAHWRKTAQSDCPLEDKLLEISQYLQNTNGCPLSQEEEQLFHFHLGNLEFAFGAELDKVSALNWDHNDKYPQFNGPHATLPAGCQVLFKRLAEQLDIHYNTTVTRVELRRNGESDQETCFITDEAENEWQADRVIVTVPVAVLKSGLIQFVPPLPEKKMAAINRIGFGIIEKVAVRFPHPFWRHKVTTPHFFGRISEKKQNRGLFAMFYDVTDKPSDSEGPFILVSVVCGSAMEWLKKEDLSDEALVKIFIETLQSLFPGVEIPAPSGYLVSQWRQERLSRMAYSYAAVNSSGEDYLTMGEDVKGKIFFAGEATNHLYPQTVPGAYLSGIRESCKIIEMDDLT